MVRSGLSWCGLCLRRPERFCVLNTFCDKGGLVIVLGIILLLIGFIAKIAILWAIGIVLVVVGAVLVLLGATGRAVGGRRHYF